MDGLLSTLTVADWVFIGVLVLIPILMVLAILSIRMELRSAARIEARSVRLKTTETQRRQWRQQTESQALIDLLDDMDTLLRQTGLDEAVIRQEHKEAVRLSWKSYHIPVRTALLGSLLLAGVISAIFMVVAQGPSSPIP